MSVPKDHMVRILEKADKGVRISSDEARELFQYHDLLSLGRSANLIARKKNGKVISYVVDRNINYTNICIGGCHFCAFSRKQDAPDAYLLTYDEIEQKVSELLSVGGTQVLLQGGLHPTLPLRWYTELISHMKKKFPDIVFH
ncbi:MAG TPA: radical SAM protein, partial [Thermodesulfobacteriota bacterium]|nr:radical SAM protein [Thermodesulfobacteriota bacterium]